MLEVATIDQLKDLRECHDCGLFQRLPEIPDGERALCARCDALLRRTSPHSLLFSGLTAAGGAILFALALTLPLVDLHVLGRTGLSNVFSGPNVLRERGFAPLAAVILITLVVMPAVKLSIELMALAGTRASPPPTWLPWLFGWLERISPWSMVEVFLLGALVAYSRLKALAHVEVGPSAIALGGALLAIVAVDATMDRETVWRALDARMPRRPQPRRTSAPPEARLIGCQECRMVLHAVEGERCDRCSHKLSVRKSSLGSVWALTIAATLLYIPANMLPVMTVERLGKGGPTTIIHGVIELGQAHLWPLALLVLLASVVVPIVKLVSLVTMLVMTHRRSPSLLWARTRLFRFVHLVGRWSMIDIFMLSVLVGVVRFGAIATVLPGMGAVAFCGVVLLTMVATELFDPRLMWDAGGRREEATIGRETADAVG